MLGKELSNSLQRQQDVKLSTEEYSCLQSLCPSGIDYESQKNQNPVRVPNTCLWTLQNPKYLEWRDNNTKRLLLISADPGCGKSGASVLDFLLAEIENQVGKIVFIFAGYNKQMEKFFEHNQGFSSRMPHRLQFADYKETELLQMLVQRIQKKYDGKMKVEGGVAGLYTRIAVRRLGRGRGREGFGNARALENILARISERQADRLHRERVAGVRPNDFLFKKEDLIGPEPSRATVQSDAWKELQGLTGLKAVKESMQGLLDRIHTNYQRELEEKEVIDVSLNRVFLGSPGTGKTSVGKLYGQVLADMGLLLNGEGQ